MYEQLLQERNVRWIQGNCNQGRTAKAQRESNFSNTSKGDDQVIFAYITLQWCPGIKIHFVLRTNYRTSVDEVNQLPAIAV